MPSYISPEFRRQASRDRFHYAVAAAAVRVAIELFQKIQCRLTGESRPSGLGIALALIPVAANARLNRRRSPAFGFDCALRIEPLRQSRKQNDKKTAGQLHRRVICSSMIRVT
jgi:hypothetical protein